MPFADAKALASLGVDFSGVLALLGLFGSAAASVAILPQLVSLSPISYSNPANTKSHAAADYTAVAALIISPAARVESCRILSSTGSSATDDSVCQSLKSSQFEAAVDRAGGRSYGKIVVPIVTSDDAGAPRPVISDIDLTVARLPPGSPIHPRVQLALTVDAQGHVEGCDLAKSSGVPALDAAACKSGVAVAEIHPVKNGAGVPVASVQSLLVGFVAYPDLVLKKDGKYADMGAAGPYFPDRAARQSVGGYANLDCAADAQGKLTDCTVDEEAPLGFGFGMAVLKMAKVEWVRVAPGAPGRVLVHIDFPRLGREGR